MKKRIMYLGVIAMLLSFVGCYPDDLKEGTTAGKGVPGKPMKLTVNMLGVGVKYKAVDDPSNPSEKTEGVIKDHTIFVFDVDGGLDVPPLYVVGDTPKTDMMVTSKATEVYIVANGGDLKDPNSFLGKKIGNKILPNYKDVFLGIETSIAEQKELGLLRTGASKITITEDADGNPVMAEVTIGLKYVAAKVVADWRADLDGPDGNPNLKGAVLTGIYILNGRAESRIFAEGIENNGNNDLSAQRQWGPLYETTELNYVHGKRFGQRYSNYMYKYFDGKQELLLLNDYTDKPGGGISLATNGGTNDYFYVLDNQVENTYDYSLEYANTLLVYAVKFANDPSIDAMYQGKTRYYTVNFNGKFYSGDNAFSGVSPNEGYSIRRGVRYTVTAFIKSNGTTDPREINTNLKYNIEAEDWIRIEDIDL